MRLRGALALAFTLGCCALASACDQGDEYPASGKRVSKLEQRVEALEKKLGERDRAKASDKEALDICLLSADGQKWNYVRLNGRKAKSDSDGDIWRASATVW